MKKQTARKGFTITELIIVIVVIAILAAVLIPTFISLVNKANQSADIQAVRQMNTVLKADEPINGKPANIAAMKAVLAADGITDYTPMYANNAYAWHNVDNVVILMDKETQKGIFPKEYKNEIYDATTWEIFGGSVNVAMDDLGDNIDEALANAKFGQTIVLSSDQTLTTTTPIANATIDLNGNKLTIPSGLPMEENANIVISNGDVESSQVTVKTGANLVLNDVELTATSSYAIYLGGHAARVDINGGTVVADCPVGTSYSSGESRHVIANLTDVQLGTEADPCEVGVSMITSSDTTITNCTIYATDKCVYDRAGNMTITNSTMNYQPAGDYEATHLDVNGSGYDTPGGRKSLMWGGATSGASAPIVVGDFHANHYSADANCTLVNVTVNSTNDTYPDVYLSQEKCDFIDNNAAANKEIVVMKTTLTCDSSIKWAVNPASYEDIKAIVGDCSSYFISKGFNDYSKYGGYEYSGSGYGGTVLMYIDNVFVNGVEQAAGSTSGSPVPAN